MPNILAVETEKQIKRQNETRRDAGGLVSQTDRQTDRRRHYASNIEKGLSGRIATATPSPIESSAAATNALRIYRVDQNKCSV